MSTSVPASANLVSIIVATNRGGAFLSEALESVMHQTHREWELVIVDDGGPDPDKLERVAEGHPGMRVIHQRSSGSSVARNVGAAATTGEFLAFLDDDDVWASDRIERHVEAFADQPATVLSYCKMHSIDGRGRLINPADQTAVAGRSDILRRRVGIFLPNIMIRRSSFERIGGFHPAFRRAQDLDLVLRAANDGPFAFVDHDLVAYRAHAGNVTRNWQELVRSIDHIIELHQWAAAERGDATAVADHRISRRNNHRYAAWSAANAARGKLRRSDYLGAAGDVAAAARLAPDAPIAWLRSRLGRFVPGESA